MASRGGPQARPEVGDVLIVVHDFKARSSDELTLAKGDRVELIERDDEFGDGWFLGKHVVNGNSGLFPEVYTRPAPKGITPTVSTAASPRTQQPLGSLSETQPVLPAAAAASEDTPSVVSHAPTSSQQAEPNAFTLPLSSAKQEAAPSPASMSFTSASASASSSTGTLSRINTQDSHMLHETLHVINEHITDMRSPPLNGALPSTTNDSGSEYSSHLDHRMSYIQGEETDEEEDASHTRAEVEAWSPDEVAEYLFTTGVEKKHCEVFRDQEIAGEVLLGMDQTSLFLKAFELGSVGRRLKTWQKIKALQDEVNGVGSSTRSRRTTQTYGSEVGSEDARRMRSRTNTLTGSIHKPSSQYEDGRLSSQAKRASISTPKLEPSHVVSPVSPLQESPASATGPFHNEKRPSAASVRDLHHSRRHSSTDFRLPGTALPATTASTAGTHAGHSPTATTDNSHKKQPSFDRNWTMGNAATYSHRPLSSAGFPDAVTESETDTQDSAADPDRGYFSGTEVDGRRRNVLRKRDSTTHSRKSSYAEEQRVRSGTALPRHSHYGSVDFMRDPGQSTAAQKYYGISNNPHRRSASQHTIESVRQLPVAKDAPSPTVTKLDASAADPSPSPVSPSNRQAVHADWLSSRPGLKGATSGLRAISDAITGNERSRAMSSADSPMKDSPVQSPSRAGSSTPSAGPSFELDSPDAAKSPSTTTTAVSHKSRKKTKKETSAYTRGLQKISPREAMVNADYSGWMKKKSSNLMTTWKPRLFVLKGRRLAYYYSEDDDQEKGLIDISFHRVLPADNERLTGLHATITGASNTPTMPIGSNMPTIADKQASQVVDKGADSMFIFKLVPPRAGLSRAVNFTKPMVHYFAVPNINQGRLWMAALMKATIDRDDTQPITTTYQQKTISLAKARQMRHRPPALMGLDEKVEDAQKGGTKKDSNGLGIVYNETDSGVSGLEKLGLQKVVSARIQPEGYALGGSQQDVGVLSPKSA